VRIVVAVFRRRHAVSRRRIRVYALQNARAMYLMRVVLARIVVSLKKISPVSRNCATHI